MSDKEEIELSEGEEDFLPVEEGDFYSYGDLLSDLGVTADEDGVHIPDSLIRCLYEKEDEPEGPSVTSLDEQNLLLLISVSHKDKSYQVRCELSVEAMKEFDDIENYGFYLKITEEDGIDEEDKNAVLDATEDKLTAFLESCKQEGGRRRRKSTKKNKKQKSKKSSNKKRTFRKAK